MSVTEHTDNKAELHTRLRRIEGQVRGLQRMVETDKNPIDVLTQISAVTGALHAIALRLLDTQLRHDVEVAARTGGPVAEARLAEANLAVRHLLRS